MRLNFITLFLRRRYMLPARFLKALLFSISFLTLNACNEYWWTRGQPPSAEELLKRAQSRITEVKNDYSNLRPEISASAEAISSRLSSLSSEALSPENLDNIIKFLEKELTSMEGKLSYGNRAPYNELCGQLRALENSNKSKLSKDSLNLYFARVLFFLTSEMKVPAPIKIARS